MQKDRKEHRKGGSAKSKCYMITSVRPQLCRAARFPHLRTSKKEQEGKSICLHQHLCLHVSSVSKECFMWHLGAGRWPGHASMARTPQFKSEWPAHSGGSGGQGEGSTLGALSSHTTSLWISSLLHHGPISTRQVLGFVIITTSSKNRIKFEKRV